MESSLTIEDAMANLANFPRLKVLMLQSQSGDDSLKHLAGLNELENIYYWDANDVTDEGVRYLAKIRSLRSIHLDHSKMTEQGLAALADAGFGSALDPGDGHHRQGADGPRPIPVPHENLHRHWSSENLRPGLKHLYPLQKLTTLDIQGAQVTERELHALLEAIPTLNQVWIQGDDPGRRRTRSTAGQAPQGASEVTSRLPG